MIKTVTQTILDGYESNHTDFTERLAQADAQVQQDFDLEIVQPLLATLASGQEAAVVTVTGHADRVDEPNLSREERRQKEFEASNARAQSAVDGLTQMLRDQSADALPDDLDELQNLAILPRAAGAAVLNEHDDALTEEQRKLNRRVQFRVVRFQFS